MRGICFVCVSSAAASLAPWSAIVDHAYDTIYRPLRRQCNDGSGMTAQECLRLMYNATHTGRYPWWARTMLRDALDPRSGQLDQVVIK